MTALVKKPGLTIPDAIIKKAGIKPGDLVAFTVRQGTITIQATAQPNESRFPLYTPTKAEKQAIAKGRAAYKRGDFITLAALHDKLEAARRRTSKKVARKTS